MNRDKPLMLLAASLLGFLTALGAAGCLLSAFDLTLSHPEAVLFAFAAAALLSAVLFAFHHGGKVLLCLTALGAGYLWRDGRAVRQLWQLACHCSTIYDRAYGLGVLILPDELKGPASYDWPMGIWGTLIAITLCRTFLRQKSLWLPMLVTLVPLGSCIVVTDTVPGEGWLMLLMVCLCVLLLTGSVRRDNPMQSLGLAALSAPLITLALMGLFLAFPQADYGSRSALLRDNLLIMTRNFPRLVEEGTRSLVSGLMGRMPAQIDLAHLGARIPFTYPVMEVTAERSGTLYLRQQDFDQYDGLGWTSGEGRPESFRLSSGASQTITIVTRGRKQELFLPYYPGEEVLLRDGRLENREEKTDYSFPQTQLPSDWRQQAVGSAVASNRWQEYCALPPATRQEAGESLAGLWPEDASNTEKADMIAALVTDSARYDLDPSLMPEGEPDFALWFLREGEKGYCVHFATAATVLLRAANVPARYVTGYMLEARANEAVTVTDENAHAWAEYYEPRLDLWLPLEATPASQAPEGLPVSVTTAPTEPPATAPAITEAAPQTTLPAETDGPAGPETSAPPLETAPPTDRISLWSLAAPFLMAGFLALQRSLRLRYYRRRQRTGSCSQQALGRWQEAVRLSRLLKDSPTEELLVLAQKAKFSQHQITPEELLQFDSFQRSCLRRLKEKPWYLRLIDQFIHAAY